jgi:hypothetical protein
MYFVFWPFPTLRGMLFWPGVQLVAVWITLMCIQRYSQHRPGDSVGYLIFMGWLGAFFICRWTLKAYWFVWRIGHRMTGAVRHARAIRDARRRQ